MHTRKIYQRIGIYGGLSLVLLLVGITGGVQTRTSARESLLPPVDQTSPASQDSAPLLQPVEEDDVNGAENGHWGRVQQGSGKDGPDSTPAGNADVLPDEEEGLGPIPGDYGAGGCPLDSDFNGSSPGWISHSGLWLIGATYLYTSGLADSWASASYIEQFGNLDYQARMWRSGCNSCTTYIVFRGTPDPLTASNNWYNEYKLQYSGEGYYSVWKRVEGGPGIAIKGWTPHPAINQGEAWNTLRVVARGTSLRFYINGVPIWSGTDSSLSSGRVGVGMYRDSSSTGDELRVDWARLCLPRIFLPLVAR